MGWPPDEQEPLQVEIECEECDEVFILDGIVYNDEEGPDFEAEEGDIRCVREGCASEDFAVINWRAM